MAVFLIQASLDNVSGLPEDLAVNTWHFEGDTTLAVIANAFDMVEDFYNAVAPGNTLTVGQYLSSVLAGTGTLKAYNLEDPIPRVPRDERAFTFTPSSQQLVDEVASVLSFQAAAESGSPQARRRNRVYLGPLGTGANLNGRPESGFQTTVLRAAKEMKNASDASLNMTWVTFSPTTAAVSGVAAAFEEVVDGWMDNAFDTQRRRGRAPTARTVFSATLPA